jgi:hypothetical protein
MYFFCRYGDRIRIVHYGAHQKLTVKSMKMILPTEEDIKRTPLTPFEIQLWKRFISVKTPYLRRKWIAIMMVILNFKSYLTTETEKEHYLQRLKTWFKDDKLDDVCDALLQGISYIEKHVL